MLIVNFFAVDQIHNIKYVVTIKENLEMDLGIFEFLEILIVKLFIKYQYVMYMFNDTQAKMIL